MNGLSDFLVESILDQEADKSVALFGGGFKPPTKGHLEVVNQGLKNNPEVSEVKILVGGGKRNGFTQEQSVKIWNLYKDIGFIDKPATIIPVSSPFTYYKEYLKNNPDDKVYVFIGSRPGEEKDQFDVNQRSEFVKKYSDNVIPVEVATEGGVSGTMARELFKNDLDGFRNMFPENLLDQDFDKIIDILNNKKEKSKEVTSNKTEPLKPINEDTIEKTDLVLPRGKKVYLQAEEEDYNRGLIVELTEEGGYKMNYWYGDDAKIYPVEVEVDGESIKPDANEVYMKFHPELEKEPLNENATYSNNINYKRHIKDLTTHMLNKGMNIQPLPKVVFKNGDKENAEDFFGKTAYYQPDTMEIVLYTEGRHPKDIVRSFAHEMIHHIQNLEGRLGGINTTNTMEDDNLNDIEREAYTKGNMTFRNWTDNIDGEEVTSLNEIGDASSKVFNYKKIQPGIDAKSFKEITDEDDRIDDIETENVYEFETDLGTKYVVNFEVEHYSDSKELNVEINFTTIGNLRMDPTNKGEQYAVMATISDIIINWINEWDKYFYISQVWIEPKVEDSEEVEYTVFSKRGRLYKVYLDKQISRLNKNYEVQQKPNAFKIVPKFKNLKETKKNKDPFGLNQYARELVSEVFKKTVIIDMDPIIKALEFEMPTGQETDENVIAIIDSAPQGKVPHPVFLDFYAKFDKYFGEENDGRMLDNFGLEYLLSNVLNLPNEDIQIVMNHYNTTDQDSVEWFEQHDNELEKDEEHNIPGFDDSGDDYDNVINYRKNQLAKSLEEQNKVRIFTQNCGCDKTKRNI